MQRYFMHLYNSHGFLPDHEGVLAPGQDVARALAIAYIRSILSEELLIGRLDLRARLEVVDESGATVLTVPFSHAVTIMIGEAS